jgi:nitroreductase
MKKTADTHHPVHELIAERWSPRAFAETSVSESDLRSILEAARWAASAFNEQPWAFIVASRDDGDAFETALSGLVDGNRTWARSAGAVLFSFAKTHFARNDKPNRHAFHDVGLATAQLTLEATARGLAVHPMSGILPDVIRETYAVPEGWEIVAGLAVGHPGDAAALPEDLRSKETGPRKRNPQSDFVFNGGWGTPR